MSGMQPSVEGFAQFCESKPPEERYEYVSHNCACHQYYKFLGIPYQDGPNPLEDIALWWPETFGACAQRARKYLA